MENENSAFAFLDTETASKYFAEVDFALKQGRHLQHYGNDAKLWDYVSDHYEQLAHYYQHLFGVYLRKDSNERDVYFYLDFPEDGHGRFVQDRNKDVDDRMVIIGILLLNMYKERFFEGKEVKWNTIEQIIEEGEQKEFWQKLLYGEAKRNYTPNEKEEMRRRMERTLSEFNRLGWITWINQEALHFEILPAIDRLSRLYANEISNVELMSEFINEQIS
ncbi:MAG: hypothetical protein J0M08_12385 [Bacteroidetes bacterium]|nr:hypothetical protein [Bacteroidota bacterium]